MEQNKRPDYFVIGRWLGVGVVLTAELMIYLTWDMASLGEMVDRVLPRETAAIVRGMVLGDETGFTSQDKEAWQKSGLWHLAVASGSNLMWLNLWLVEGLASFLGRKQALVVAGIGIWVYTAVLAWPVALVRASMLMTIYYWSQWLGRRFDVWRAVGVGAMVMMAGDYRVIGQAGFWLSMGAYMAVVGWQGNREEVWWKRELKTSIRVAWFIWPVMAIIGGKMSIAGPVGALLVAPVAPVILGGGMVNLGLAMIWEKAAALGWWLLAPLVEWVGTVAELGAKWGVVENIGSGWMVLAGWVMITWWVVRRGSDG